MKKFYADRNGYYLTTLDAGALPEEKRAAWFQQHAPRSAVEVNYPPSDARAIWNGQAWDEPELLPAEPSIADKVAALETKLAGLEAKLLK